MLPESATLGALPRVRIVGPQQMQKIGRLQARGTISQPFFVDQQWKVDARLFAEQRSVMRVSQADCSQSGAFALEFGFVLAQLRDVLAAEDSPIVAKENNHGRVRLPQ